MSKQYKNPVCRGSHALGTACGKCDRCRDQATCASTEKVENCKSCGSPAHGAETFIMTDPAEDHGRYVQYISCDQPDCAMTGFHETKEAALKEWQEMQGAALSKTTEQAPYDRAERYKLSPEERAKKRYEILKENAQRRKDAAEQRKLKNMNSRHIVAHAIRPLDIAGSAVIDTYTGEVIAFSQMHAHDIADALNKTQEG